MKQRNEHGEKSRALGDCVKCVIFGPISCPLNIHHVLILDDDNDYTIVTAVFFLFIPTVDAE